MPGIQCTLAMSGWCTPLTPMVGRKVQFSNSSWSMKTPFWRSSSLVACPGHTPSGSPVHPGPHLWDTGERVHYHSGASCTPCTPCTSSPCVIPNLTPGLLFHGLLWDCKSLCHLFSCLHSQLFRPIKAMFLRRFLSGRPAMCIQWTCYLWQTCHVHTMDMSCLADLPCAALH